MGVSAGGLRATGTASLKLIEPPVPVALQKAGEEYQRKKPLGKYDTCDMTV